MRLNLLDFISRRMTFDGGSLSAIQFITPKTARKWSHKALFYSTFSRAGLSHRITLEGGVLAREF